MKKTYLVHYGIKGQKWGRRRYQNEDGSLTPEGVRRYGSVENYNRSQDRKKKIAYGVAGVTAGTAAYLAIKNRKNKKTIGEFNAKEAAKQLANKERGKKAAATKKYRKENGIKMAKILMKDKSDIKVTEYIEGDNFVMKKVTDFLGAQLGKTYDTGYRG